MTSRIATAALRSQVDVLRGKNEALAAELAEWRERCEFFKSVIKSLESENLPDAAPEKTLPGENRNHGKHIPARRTSRRVPGVLRERLAGA